MTKYKRLTIWMDNDTIAWLNQETERIGIPKTALLRVILDRALTKSATSSPATRRMRIPVILDHNLETELKKAARESGYTVSEFICQVIQKEMSARLSPASATGDNHAEPAHSAAIRVEQ